VEFFGFIIGLNREHENQPFSKKIILAAVSLQQPFLQKKKKLQRLNLHSHSTTTRQCEKDTVCTREQGSSCEELRHDAPHRPNVH
jgi:hypothetical protein